MHVVWVDRDEIKCLHQIQLREFLATGQVGSEIL